MIEKQQQQIDDMRTSLKRIRQINGTHQLPPNIDKSNRKMHCRKDRDEIVLRSTIELLDQCSNLIQKYIDKNDGSTMIKTKDKQHKRKSITGKRIKQISKRIQSKKKIPKTNHSSLLTNNYPCYPSSFPCFRSCGPINCPKNKLPMPRDLWHRLIYSQLVEEQHGKRKRSEDSSSNENLTKNQSNRYDSSRQKTMNAALSSSTTKVVKHDITPIERKSILEWNGSESLANLFQSNLGKSVPIVEHVQYIPLTLPLTLTEESGRSKESIQPCLSEGCTNMTRHLTNTDQHQLCSKEHINTENFFTETSQIELIPHSAFKRNASMTGVHDKMISVPSTMLSNDPSRCDILTIASSEPAYEQSTTMISKHDSFVSFEHPLLNHMIEYYHLDQISRSGLCKRLQRRLLHVRQTMNEMSTSEIEIKLKHKRDALMKKRQTSVEIMTRDERIAMAELELNVYEYVKTLDTRSQPIQPIINDEFDIDRSNASPSLHLPVLNSSIDSQTSMTPSISTVHAVQPSQLSQSTNTRHSKHISKTISTGRSICSSSTIEPLGNVSSWSHALLPELMNMFDSLTDGRRHQIEKQLARRYDHIRKKVKEMTHVELNAQIEAKSKALVQSKQMTQANEDELLRIAELEISLFELEIEQSERNHRQLNIEKEN